MVDKSLKVIQGDLRNFYKKTKKGIKVDGHHWKFDATKDEGLNVFSFLLHVNADLTDDIDRQVSLSCYEYIKDSKGKIQLDKNKEPITKLKKYRVKAFCVQFEEM